MIVDCISDMHGEYPNLSGGDLLIIAGDITSNDTVKAWKHFYSWLKKQNYTKKIYIGGNHDMFLTQCLSTSDSNAIKQEINDDLGDDACDNIVYLCDSQFEFGGLKIWGSPWIRKFHGMNKKCTAFGLDLEIQLCEKFQNIPDDVDILITHSPPFGMLDICRDNKRLGSKALGDRLLKLKQLKLHVFGHIHEAHGACFEAYLSEDAHDTNLIPYGHLSVNASCLNGDYDPYNNIIRVHIDEQNKVTYEQINT